MATYCPGIGSGSGWVRKWYASRIRIRNPELRFPGSGSYRNLLWIHTTYVYDNCPSRANY